MIAPRPLVTGKYATGEFHPNGKPRSASRAERKAARREDAEARAVIRYTASDDADRVAMATCGAEGVDAQGSEVPHVSR